MIFGEKKGCGKNISSLTRGSNLNYDNKLLNWGGVAAARGVTGGVTGGTTT